MKAKMWKFNCFIDLTDPTELKNIFNDLLIESGFGVPGYLDYHFYPQGFSAIWLLSESHFAIHTFPERKKTYIELSSCTVNPFKKFKSHFEGKISGARCNVVLPD